MEIHELSRKGLITLVQEYDNYIKDICNDEQNDMHRYPVCVNEYINNEFMIGKNQDDYKIKVVSFGEKYDDLFTETSAEIMDIFENILDQHNINIPDSNRVGEENEARIFGETYYNIESQVENIIEGLVTGIYKDLLNEHLDK